MRTRIIDDVCILLLDSGEHFLGEKGFQEILKLSEALEEARMAAGIRFVLLWQEFASSQKKLEDFIRNEAPGMLLADWMHRALQFRKILLQIRTLDLPVLWAGNGACLSTHWELALAVRSRVWFGRNILLGFPELAYRRLPPGGSLDFQNFLPQRVKEFFLSSLVCGLASAREHQLIHWYGGSSPDKEGAIRWMRIKSRLPMPGSMAKAGGKADEGSDPASVFSPLPWSTLTAASLNRMRQRELRSSADYFEVSTQLIKSKKLAEAPGEANNLLVKFIGKCWLGSPALPVKNPGPFLPPIIGEPDDPEPETIWIDTSECAPPAGSIAGLLRSGYRLVLFGAKGKALAAMLERSALKLEKREAKKELLQLWSSRTSWITVASVYPTLNCLKWSSGEFLDCRIEGQEYRLLNLESSPISPEPGCLEDLSPENLAGRHPKLRRILRNVSREVLPGVWLCAGTPASSWIRLMFLQELLELAHSLGCELSVILAALQETGWGFISSDSRWSYFLQTRQGRYPESPDLVMPARGLWDPGGWKHVLAGFQGYPVNKKRKKNWHATGLCQHFALYASALTRYIAGRKPYTCQENISHLVSRSAGFPASRGTPELFIRSYGTRRALLYQEHFWKHLQ